MRRVSSMTEPSPVEREVAGLIPARGANFNGPNLLLHIAITLAA